MTQRSLLVRFDVLGCWGFAAEDLMNPESFILIWQQRHKKTRRRASAGALDILGANFDPTNAPAVRRVHAPVHDVAAAITVIVAIVVVAIVVVAVVVVGVAAVKAPYKTMPVKSMIVEAVVEAMKAASVEATALKAASAEGKATAITAAEGRAATAMEATAA